MFDLRGTHHVEYRRGTALSGNRRRSYLRLLACEGLDRSPNRARGSVDRPTSISTFAGRAKDSVDTSEIFALCISTAPREKSLVPVDEIEYTQEKGQKQNKGYFLSSCHAPFGAPIRMKIDALTDLPRRASAIPPPARLRAGAPDLPTPPQGGSNGGHGEFPPSIDHHAAGWRLPTASAVAWWATRGLPLQMQRRGQPRGVPTQMLRGGRGFSAQIPQALRPKTPQRSAGHNRLLPPQGQFAEKQPPRRLSGLPAARCAAPACASHADRQAGALLFRPFSWASNERQPAASPPPPFSPFPLRKGGRGDRSLYRNTSTGFARAARTA